MIPKVYYWLHKKFSKPDERGEYSAGVWQDAVREKVFELCTFSSGKLLEVGCGEGLFLLKFSQTANIQLFGIDIWEDILKKAKQRLVSAGMNNVVLKQGDAQKLIFEDATFDRVVCVNVFFNLPADEAVRGSLKEMARVIKDDGKILFDFRNSRNPLLFAKYKFAKYYDETVKDLPLRTYDLTTIALYAKEAGLEIVKIIPIGFPYNNLSPLFVIEARKVI